MTYIIYPPGSGGNYLSHLVKDYYNDDTKKDIYFNSHNEYYTQANGTVYKFHLDEDNKDAYEKYKKHVNDMDETYIITVNEQNKSFTNLLVLMKRFFKNEIKKRYRCYLDGYIPRNNDKFNTIAKDLLIEPKSIFGRRYTSLFKDVDLEHYKIWCKNEIQKFLNGEETIMFTTKPINETVKNSIIISYEDLFIKGIDTNSIFDNYKEQNKIYYQKNIELINKVSDEFDIDLRKYIPNES